uniref:Uncharacterized protein n=1 Tax=Trichobilharzia regenti TaxID=157069 RepID=A0AA85JWS5_TRIRE|nr:unnamed protein product [Trichobilharzia regenti]
MERSLQSKKNDEFGVANYSSESGDNNGRELHLSQDVKVKDSSEPNFKDIIRGISEALNSAADNFEECTQTLETSMKHVNDLVEKAKSLETKLRNKKCFLIDHFQTVFSNLEEDRHLES